MGKVDVEVAEGIVLLTGSVPTIEDKMEAEKIAWSAPNVLQVGNEIQLNKPSGFFKDSEDALIGANIRTRLIAEKGVKARNINIEMENGTVYLLGVARDHGELQKITHIASTSKGVKEVISYIKVHGQPVVNQASYAAPQNFGVPIPESGTSPTPYIVPQQSYPTPDPSIPFLPRPGDQSGNQIAEGDLPRIETPAPTLPPANEPYYRDPITGERIILPPGTKTVPYDPNDPQGLKRFGDAPYYIDPSNGQKVQIIWTGE